MMHQLPEPVLSEFKRRNVFVKRSAHKFSQVDPGRSMEWVNGTGKKGGGIIGISKTTSELFRWTISFNLRSHIAELTHEIYSPYGVKTDLHKEVTESRQKRDIDDDSSLLSCPFSWDSICSRLYHIQVRCKTLLRKTWQQRWSNDHYYVPRCLNSKKSRN